MDGGILQDVPIALCSRLGADHVLAVSFLSDPTMPAQLDPLGLVERTVAFLVTRVQVPAPPDVHAVRIPVQLPPGAGLLSYGLFGALVKAGHDAAMARRHQIEDLTVPF